MKEIILIVGLLFSLRVGYAQKVQHPALLYTPERITQVQQLFVTCLSHDKRESIC